MNDYISPYQIKIEDILLQQLNPVFLKIIDNSHLHGKGKYSSSHFKIICVSNKFSKLSLINRHRTVQSLLHHLINNPIHSLEYSLHSPEEWDNNPHVNPSPKCTGKHH